MDGAEVAFEADRAVVDGGEAVVLSGPDGLRIPGEGALRLPWRARGPEAPKV